MLKHEFLYRFINETKIKFYFEDGNFIEMDSINDFTRKNKDHEEDEEKDQEIKDHEEDSAYTPDSKPGNEKDKEIIKDEDNTPIEHQETPGNEKDD